MDYDNNVYLCNPAVDGDINGDVFKLPGFKTESLDTATGNMKYSLA